MSRWTVNPLQLARNIAQAYRFGASFRDRWNYLTWMYHDKAFVPASRSGRRVINFQFPPPIGPLRIKVRDNLGSDQLVLGEVFFKREYEVAIKAPDTILDLGGNIGMATLYFARRWPKAQLAVAEPEPANLELLRENLGMNSVEAIVFPAAVAVSDGNVSLSLGQLDCTHQIQVGANGQSNDGSITVPSLSIRSMLKQLGWERIGLLKVDIEGYEAVLLGQSPDWLQLVDAVCIEVHEDAMSSEAAQNIAIANQFQVQVNPDRIQYWTRPRVADQVK